MTNITSSFRKIGLFSTFGAMLSCGTLLASGNDSLARELSMQEAKKPLPFAGTSRLFLNPNYSPLQGISLNDHFNYIGKEKQGKGLFSEDVVVSGVFRSLVIYRDMKVHYDDLVTSSKNISFADYPISLVASGYPWLELNLASKVRSKIDFNVGYSLTPAFTGNVENSSSRKFAATQNINFSGRVRNGLFETSLMAGEVLWTNMSKFTMGQPEFRDNYFDRLPWDWYRRSFDRFGEYFRLSSNIGNQNLGRSPLTGVVFQTEYLPYQVSFKGLFGRTNRSASSSLRTDYFPSWTAAGRLEKVFFERVIKGKIGANYYAKRAKVNFTDLRNDNNTVATLDFDFKISKVLVSGEFGAGNINNPATASLPANKKWAPGYYFRTEFDKRVVLVPFSVEYFHIAEGLVSLDGGILNANTDLRDGGYLTEAVYDGVQYIGVSQEVGQIVNNRQGANLRIEGGVGSHFKAQFGYSTSGELENKHDTITMQHRVNAFSRSRFRPWFQAGGPYHRIKSNWFRTYETITIDTTKAGNSKTYTKGFNTTELLLKGKINIGSHELIILNFNSLNAVMKNFNPMMVYSSVKNKNTFITVLYEDLTVAFSLTQKLNVVAEYGFEITKGSTMVDLSPDKIKKDDGTLYKDEERTINQKGTTIAGGIDYDINRTMSLHLRHRYMTHVDYNFTKDKFNGSETTFEFKIFF